VARVFEGWTIRVPRPIQVTHAPPALTMTAVAGGPLEACAGAEAFIASAARAFAVALRTAWNEGLLHGDLGLRNVLIDLEQRSIALIDPGPGEACRACDANDCCAPAHDLGHLVTELVTDVSDMIGSSPAGLAKQNFVATVLQSAARAQASWVSSVVPLLDIES
jgi:tRNA A-37 threonylcarbamoyl transferase component Bud32